MAKVRRSPSQLPADGPRQAAHLGFDRDLILGEPVDALDPRRGHRQRRARADHQLALLRIDADDVERLGLAADLDPAALADGEVDDALMAARARGRRDGRCRPAPPFPAAAS